MIKINHIALATLAVLGTTAAMAQSTVTIYGRFNTTMEHQKLGDQSVTGMFSNSSRFGIQGSEDLGGGLKAGFTIESGFNSDSGTGAGANGSMNFARRSELNITGSLGMLRVGNFLPESYFATADQASMHNHDTGSSADILYHDPVWLGELGKANKIAYRTPKMNGFWAEGAMVLHEKAAAGAKKTGYDLAANYDKGPLSLGAGYTSVNDNWQVALRTAYTIGQFRLAGYYQHNKDTNQLATGGAGTRDNYRLSAMYTQGASQFHANIGRASNWSNIQDSAATQWTLGYNYNVSKRTKIYGYYSKIHNGIGRIHSGTSVLKANVAGGNFSTLAVGIRHNF